MATIGSLAVNIITKTEMFESGIKRVRSLLGGLRGTIGSIGGLFAFGALVRTFESVGSELHDFSEATGVAVEMLSFLKYAAEQSGSSLEVVVKAIRELQSKGIDPNRFVALANSVAAIQDPVKRAQRAFEVFGKKAGAALLPMLRDMPALQRRFEFLGGSMTKEMANSADALGDAIGDLKFAFTGITNVIAAQLAPAITSIANTIANNGKFIRKWIEDHRLLIQVIGGLLFVLTILNPVLGSLDAIVNIGAGSWKLLTKAIWGAQAAMVAFKAVAASAWLAKALAAVGGVVAAVGGWPVALGVLLAAGGVGWGIGRLLKNSSATETAAKEPEWKPATAPMVDNSRVEQNTSTMATLLSETNRILREREVQRQRSQPQSMPQIAIAGVR